MKERKVQRNEYLREKSLKHYDRMILIVKALIAAGDGLKKPDEDALEALLGENWYAGDCVYCQKHADTDERKYKSDDDCGKCPLTEKPSDVENCCNGLWRRLENARTWEAWLERAIKVKAYIAKKG